MRFIDADALIRRFKVRGCFNKEMLGYMVAKVINSAPTVDAVKVVRCKDCNHATFDLNGKYIWCDRLDGIVTFYDDFCSYGERKEK